MTALRSLVFAVAMIVITPPFALVSMLTLPLSPMARFRFISIWSRIMLSLLATICGLRYRVEGREHLPAEPCVVLSKHQSAWETLAFQTVFPPQVFLLKRELLWIPFFGWALALMSPIAIDRSRGTSALKSLARAGAERLKQGFWIVIYPEGTRVAPGVRRKYQSGGAWLAVRTGVRVVPVAHNAGQFWPRNGFMKHPGTIEVRIGPPISTRGRTVDEVNSEVEHWIEAQQEELCPAPAN